MKLLKLKCDDGQLDYMVKFETADEDNIYTRIRKDESWGELSAWLEEQVGITDIQVAYYFMSNDNEPKIGEIFTDDDYEWERVA